MRLPKPAVQRALALPIALSTLLATSALIGVAPAVADTSVPSPISAVGLPTVQIDGVVWSQTVAGATVYAGGSFGTARPAGAAAGTDTTVRTDLLAYDVTSGDLDTGFDVALNGQVRAVAMSPDGSRLYIGGDFTTVDGVARPYVAAVDPATGALITSFAPSVNSSVHAVAATSGTVFIGGQFTAVDGAARTRAAAVDAATGAVTSFDPAISGGNVDAIAVSPDRSKVVIGGQFNVVNGDSVTSQGIAALDFLTGASDPWAAGQVIWDGGQSAGITSLSVSQDAVYATGFVYGSGDLEGAVSMNWGDGSIRWLEDCHGDSYSSVPYDGAVYIASHAHFCGNVGGWQETVPQTFHRVTAFSQATTGTVAHNTTDPSAYHDWGGLPAPTLLDWYPDLEPGSYTGKTQAAWSVAAGDGYVVYGGEFPSVNGTAQQGLVRFQGWPDDSGTTDAPDPSASPTPTPTATASPAPTATVPSSVGKPTVAALGKTWIGVRWSATDGDPTRYTVHVRHGSSTVKTVTTSASERVLTVKGLKKHTKYAVSVTATNAAGSATASSSASVTTFSRGAHVSATKTPAKPAKPTAKARTTSITVKWQATSTSGATSVSHYQVRVYAGTRFVKSVTVSGGVRSATVKGLKRHTTYRVGVRAENFAGWSTGSSRRSIRTAS